MSAQNPIGIFDSGIGGLTIAHAINRILPNESIIYFGDTQHLPYGNKSEKKINYYSNKIVDFLLDKKCKVIVIACNSASSVAFKGILTNTKNKCLLFNVIDPVIQFISNQKNIKKIGVIGTTATINSNIYKTKINALQKDVNVSSLATPLLASLIEENSKELYTTGILESYLKNPQLNNIDSLILGCTHYPIIESQIRSFYNKKINIIDATKYIGQTIYAKLKKYNLMTENQEIPKHQFYVSDYTRHFQQKTKLFFSNEIILQEENIFS